MTEKDDLGYSSLAADLLADIADALLRGTDWQALHRLRAALNPDVATIKDVLGRPDPDMIKEAMERGLYSTTSGDIMKSIYSEEIREQLSSHAEMHRMLNKPPVEAPREYITWTDSSTQTSNPSIWSYSVHRRNGKNGSA